MTQEENLSQTITCLRFPLIVGVVLLHTILQGQVVNGILIAPAGQYPFYDVFLYISQRIIGDMAVPLFFFISGFLLFYNVKEYDFQMYSSKLRKRVHSLLFPYLLWNVLFMVFIITIYYIYPSLMHSMGDYCRGFNTLVFLKSLTCSPVLSPMWFIRDLIVFNILSLPVFYLIKRFGIIPILILGVLFLLNIWSTTAGSGTKSAFYLSLGAWFGIKKCNFIYFSRRYSVLLSFGLILFAIVDIYLWRLSMPHYVANQFAILMGVFLIPMAVSICINKELLSTNTFWAESSFFVFAFHMFIINVPNKMWSLFVPVNVFTLSVMQWLIPLSVSFLCTFIYFLVKKITPCMASLLVGGR